MLDIQKDDDGTIYLTGRFDAAQVDRARPFLESLSESTVLDMKRLEYISSAGLSLFIATQKRLCADGKGLTLANVNVQIMNVLRISGLDSIFAVK